MAIYRGKDTLGTWAERKVFIELPKLLWTGTYKAIRGNKYIGFLYAGLVALTVIVGITAGSWGWMILLIFCVAVGLGLRHHMKDAPLRKKKRFFHDVFVTMGFYAKGNIYPEYITEVEINEYMVGFAFATLIPVSSWKARQEEMTMYFGDKIIDIRISPNDNRVVHVLVEAKPLPTQLDWHDRYMVDTSSARPKHRYPSSLLIGVCYMGSSAMNLERHPHAFIAGETGSGKSNILKCLIYQALAKNYEVALIDFKRGVSFAAFSDSVTIYYEYPDVVKVLGDNVEETKNRLDRFRGMGVDNIGDYNRTIADTDNSTSYMKRKIVFIDELAELLKTRDKETANALNDSIETLTRLSRAVGIHLIMGIQRPDSTIVSGQIKNNVSFRVCGRFVDKEPSRIMLGNDTASNLPNIKGRFIVKDDNMYEVQAFYFLNNIKAPSSQNANIPTDSMSGGSGDPQPIPQLEPKEPEEQSAPKATQAHIEPNTDIVSDIIAEPPRTEPQGEKPKDIELKAQKPEEASIDFDFTSFKK